MKKLKQLLNFLAKNKRYAVLFVVFVILYVAVFVIFKKFEIGQDDIQNFVTPFGIWGPLALLLAQIVFSLTPMPDAAMPMLAFVLYGIPGVLLIMLGMFIAAVIHYYIGKILGKEFIIKHFPLVSKLLGGLNNGNTIIKLIYMRLFTMVSFDVTSYIAGISNIDFKTFAIALAIGLIPANLTLILISSGLFASTPQDAILIWGLIILSLTGLAYLYKRSTIK